VPVDSLTHRGHAGFVEARLHATLLAKEPGLALWRVRCSCPRSGFEARSVTPQPLLVIVHRGAFIRRARGGTALADGGFAYFAGPDDEEEFAHPDSGGDVCTSLMLDPALLVEVTGDALLPMRPVAVDSTSFRRVLALLAEASNQLRDDWAERALNLFGCLLWGARLRSTSYTRESTRQSHRAAIDHAREAILHDPSLTVRELARVVGYSPYHLSRVFQRDTGASISAYRLRIRTRSAVQFIRDGETDLARLARDLGFCDHSHMTRMIQREVGRPPRAIRYMGSVAAIR
jgi:AraC-like DNA-binding protein